MESATGRLKIISTNNHCFYNLHMQFNNSKHCLPKYIVKISETKKDYSACHTNNKLSFLPQERSKKYILSINLYILSFPLKFHIAKMHISCNFSDTNACLFGQKINL